MSFIHSEAVRLFTQFYQVKNSTGVIVLDCAVYPALNGYTGQILSFIQQNGQYTVSVKSTQATSTCFIMQIHHQLPVLHTLGMISTMGLNKSMCDLNKYMIIWFN